MSIPPHAYAFRLNSSAGGLTERLDRWARWSWGVADSGWLGDYRGTRPVPHDGVIRIYQEGDHFVLVVLFQSSRPDAWSDYLALHTMLREEFLPSIGATDVSAHDGLDVRGEGYHGPPRE